MKTKRAVSNLIWSLIWGLMLTLGVGAASAQSTITVTATPTSVKPGQQVVLTWTLSGATQPAALQAQPALPTGWNAAPPTATAALSATPKQIQCSSPSTAGLNATCVIWGANLTLIPNTAIVTESVMVPVTAGAGPQVATLTNAFGSNTSGVDPTAITVVPVTITVLPSPYDITGDGQVTIADIAAMATQVANGNCTADPAGLGGPCKVNRILDEISGWLALGSKP